MDGTLYTSLDPTSRAIRLVKILPSSVPEDPLIYCELQVSSLNHKPKYCALSYSWKDESKSSGSISLNGRTFTVTSRQQTALAQLRSADKPLTIWIDALCINQEDSVEKNWQVKQMRQIYEQATNVILWLGDGPDVCHEIVSILNNLLEHLKF